MNAHPQPCHQGHRYLTETEKKTGLWICIHYMRIQEGKYVNQKQKYVRKLLKTTTLMTATFLNVNLHKLHCFLFLNNLLGFLQLHTCNAFFLHI